MMMPLTSIARVLFAITAFTMLAALTETIEITTKEVKP